MQVIPSREELAHKYSIYGIGYPIYGVRLSLDHYNRYLIWCDPHPLASTEQQYLPRNWVR